MEKYAGNLVQVKEEFLYFTSFVMLYLLKSMKVLPEKKSLNICIAVLRCILHFFYIPSFTAFDCAALLFAKILQFIIHGLDK